MERFQGIKTAMTVSIGSTITGIFTGFIDLIPDNIGKLAALAGFVLSCVLTYIHLRRGLLETKKLEIEIAKLENRGRMHVDNESNNRDT